MQCPNCGADAPEEYRFCEACGTGLRAPLEDAAGAPARVLKCRCGAGVEAKDEQGFCTACGRRWEPAGGRDHVELTPTPHLAAVTDRGLRHPRNEDDVVLAMREVAGKPVYVLVVCDGVSSSQTPDTASATAATAATRLLTDSLAAGMTDPKSAILDAIMVAHRAVCALPYVHSGPKDPPSTTIVVALVMDGVATVGWVGDSRAYWFGTEGSGVLTHDHSWINEMVDAGQMTAEEAEHAPEAHAITQCLGLMGDGGPEVGPAPTLISFTLPAPCKLLLCTDGLWNYAPTTEQIAELMAQAPAEGGLVAMCRALVQYVLDQGARDNVTVALLEI